MKWSAELCNNLLGNNPYAQTGPVTLQVTADTYTRGGKYADKKYGSETTLVWEGSPFVMAFTVTDDNWQKNTIIKNILLFRINCHCLKV